MSTPEPKLAWAYLRVSTEKQEVENQRLQIGKFAETHGYWIPEDRWYVEDATHGTVPALSRPLFRKMHDDLVEMALKNKDGLPSNTITYEVSRFGRTFWETLEAIKFIEDLSPILSSSPKESFIQIADKSMRNFLLAILAWVAEREREQLVQRTKDGVARAREEGKHSGNIPLGYDMVAGKLIINSMGKSVWELYNTNPKVRAVQIGKILNIEYKQAWNLLQSVKRFGLQEPSAQVQTI